MSTKKPPDLVPELIVSSLKDSLGFWCGLLRFEIACERPEEEFAMIRHGGAWLRLDEKHPQNRHWITADLEKPLARGINFEIQMDDLDENYADLKSQQTELFMNIEEACYRVTGTEVHQRQFLIQNPDGYLIRIARDVSKS